MSGGGGGGPKKKAKMIFLNFLIDFERVCRLGKCKEKNSKYLIWGPRGGAPIRQKQGGLGTDPQRLAIFKPFNENNAFLSIII